MVPSLALERGAHEITCTATDSDAMDGAATVRIEIVQSLACTGDCNDNGAVTIDELIKGVNIALGNLQIEDCGAFDDNGDAAVTINELVKGVRNALDGC